MSPSSSRGPRRVRWGLRALLAGMLAVSSIGCATLSVDQERELGVRMHQQVAYSAPLLQDEVVVSYIAKLGQRMVAAGPPQPFHYTFNVVVDPAINAFAGPGGHIYVHTGTILRARNVNELAGVIAHEIGHVVHRHVAENYGRQRAARTATQLGVVAASVAAGSAGAMAADLVGGVTSLTVLNSFGRGAERESDAYAVEIMPKAGYDPSGLPTFFQTLINEGEGSAPSFLSSHPATQDRIEETRALIDALPPANGLRSDDGGRFEIIQHRVRLLTEPRGAPPAMEHR